MRDTQLFDIHIRPTLELQFENKMRRIFTSIFTLVLLISSNVNAQQILGGDITWECVGSGSSQGKYVFTLTVYNLCIQGSLPTGSLTIDVQGA
ncbi:MAG TPA: hypothetical protein DCX54_09610, partial [Flavobacteriales bacterium]|nr:hypothetical protein [Flavobacteriales bacterium]